VIGDDAPVLFPAAPPLDDVHDAVYDATGVPFVAPGVNATVIDALPRVTLVIVGASGAAAAAGAMPMPSTKTIAANATKYRDAMLAPRSRTRPSRCPGETRPEAPQ
jgi:hypothetical protein